MTDRIPDGTCPRCRIPYADPSHFRRHGPAMTSPTTPAQFERFMANLPPTAQDFDGETYDPALDGLRLNAQLRRVFGIIRDGNWRTLAELAEVTGDPEASVSARLRDLRKPRFGQFAIERRRRSPGTFEYRLRLPGQLQLGMNP